jgi:hypothetical protein
MSDTSGTEAESFLTKAKKALNDLVEVKVVTVVGSLTITITTQGDSTNTKLASKEIASDAIVTVVKLLDGDVTTVIAPDLVANSDLRALHTAQVAESLKVLPANLKALVDIAKSLIDR